MTFLRQFFQDPRTLTLFGFIVIDLVTGIIAALRAGAFDLGSVGLFYRSNVLPFILGYLLVYAVSLLGIAALLGPLWGDVAATVGAGPALLNLAASIGRNLGTVRAAGREVR